MHVAARAKQTMSWNLMLGNFVFLYKTYLTFMIEIFITIPHDECIFIIQMKCWILKLEARKKEHQKEIKLNDEGME
jgi:hypothetical protein